MTGAGVSTTRNARRQTRSEAWLVGGGIVVGVALLAVVGLFAGTSGIPHIPIPSPSPLPSPNGFTIFLRAASLTTGEAGEYTMGLRPKPTPTERAAMLRRNRMALETFRSAFDYTYQNPPARSFTDTFPHLPAFAELSQTAVWEARDLWERGQVQEAAETCRDIVRFGIAIPRGGSKRQLSMGGNIEEDGRELLWEMREALPAPVARTIARDLYEMDRQRVPFAAILEEWKWATLSATLELYRTGSVPHILNTGVFARTVPPVPWWQNMATSLSLAPVAPRQVIERMTTYLDAQIARARKPYQANREEIPPPEDPVNRFMVRSDYRGIHIWSRGNEMMHRLLTVALALRAYRLEKGSYPDSLETLVSSGYLPAVPHDPFTDSLPLRYRCLPEGRYLLYSVGPDGQDDNGKPITEKGKPVTAPMQFGMQGDFVVGENIR